MKISDTISVNPSKHTLGQADAQASSIFRNPVLGAETSQSSLNLVKLLFPTALAGSSEMRKYDIPLRTIFATVLIVTGLTILTLSGSIHGTGFAITSICFGCLLAIGLFTRPLMLGAAIYYCVTGALTLRTGVADMTIFALMFGCLVFALTGSGKYSCDALILRSINRHKIFSKRKREEKMMGYKAFHHVKF